MDMIDLTGGFFQNEMVRMGVHPDIQFCLYVMYLRTRVYLRFTIGS